MPYFRDSIFLLSIFKICKLSKQFSSTVLPFKAIHFNKNTIISCYSNIKSLEAKLYLLFTFFYILCVLYIHTYVNDLFPIRSLWTWRTQTLLRLSGSQRSFSPTPRKSFQPIGVIRTSLIANGRKQGIRVSYSQQGDMLIIKVTVS